MYMYHFVKISLDINGLVCLNKVIFRITVVRISPGNLSYVLSPNLCTKDIIIWSSKQHKACK